MKKIVLEVILGTILADGKEYKIGEQFETSEINSNSLIKKGVAKKVEVIEQKGNSFSNIKKEELIEYCKESNIKIPDKATKTDILAIIEGSKLNDLERDS